MNNQAGPKPGRAALLPSETSSPSLQKQARPVGLPPGPVHWASSPTSKSAHISALLRIFGNLASPTRAGPPSISAACLSLLIPLLASLPSFSHTALSRPDLNQHHRCPVSRPEIHWGACVRGPALVHARHLRCASSDLESTGSGHVLHYWYR